MKKGVILILVLILAPACSTNVSPAATTEPTPILEKTNTSAPIPTPTIPPPTPTSTVEVPTATPIPSPEPTRTPSLEKLRDLPYIVDGSPKQVLDIYLPTSPGGPFPTILTAHGGGGDKADFSRFATRFAQLGYAVASINYREPPAAIYPAAVQDTFCALAWIYTHASAYNLDTERLFALGHSSGGTLVAMLGTVDDPSLFLEGCPHPFPETSGVQGVVTFTGIFDYVRASAYSTALQNYTNTYLGAEQDATPEVWAEASPVSWVDGNEPPFLVIHGEADRNIDPGQSGYFADTLEAAKADVHLLLIAGLDHGGIVTSEIALEAVETFLDALAFP